MDAGYYYAAQLALFDGLVAGHANTTVVPLRSEYVGAATCLTLVHLLPNELSVLIENQVLGRLSAFRSKHYWYPPADLHLTFKNIRRARAHPDFPGELIERASIAISRVCRATTPLEFDVLGPVCLPTSIVVRAIGTLAHREMMVAFDRELSNLGVPDDKTAHRRTSSLGISLFAGSRSRRPRTWSRRSQRCETSSLRSTRCARRASFSAMRSAAAPRASFCGSSRLRLNGSEGCIRRRCG